MSSPAHWWPHYIFLLSYFLHHIFPPGRWWVRKRRQCCWATVPQASTRPLEVQTAKVQLSCWATLEQSSSSPSSPHHSLSPSLPLWWLMANAALAHLYIPSHPSLANRCEILDMAWIWLPGEKKKKRVGGCWGKAGVRQLKHRVPISENEVELKLWEMVFHLNCNPCVWKHT